jgi:hypothetical protein
VAQRWADRLDARLAAQQVIWPPIPKIIDPNQNNRGSIRLPWWSGGVYGEFACPVEVAAWRACIGGAEWAETPVRWRLLGMNSDAWSPQSPESGKLAPRIKREIHRCGRDSGRFKKSHIYQ